MADEWRRYLRQQIELGGAEIVLGPAAGDRAAVIARREATKQSGGAGGRSVAPDSGAEGERGEASMAKDDKSPPKWMKGAPPIPGPGLEATAPPTELLGEEFAGMGTLEAVAERVRGSRCHALFPECTNTVPGEGHPSARLMLVGEAPGATEDATGRPFVGQAGQLLDSILQAVDLRREEVFIANVVKCRPPQNRKPLPDEVAACIPFLWRQIELIQPKVILALGGTAAESLLDVKKPLGELRNKVHTFNGIPLVVTYHPAALLRNPNWKKPTWDDVRIARQLLDR